MAEKKELDLEAITAELDAEFSEQEATQEEEVAEPETQVQDDTDLDETEEGVEEVEEEFEEEESEPTIDDDDVHKRNEAFKRLRQERDQLAKSDEFLSNLAAQYGMTKEQLIARYQDQIDAQQAKAQGVDPTQYKKMRELEDKIYQIEQEKSKEIFNLRANQMATEYNLDDDQMVQLFEKASELKVDILQNPDLLDFVYKAVNYDNAIEKGRQSQLETSKKRQATSTGRTGTFGKQVDTTEDDVDREIENYLRENNIIRS